MKKTILFLIMLLCTVCSWGVEYDLWIQGERVTSENCNSFYYGNVRYDALSKTLTLNNCWMQETTGYDYAIDNKINGLNIILEGVCGLGGKSGAIHSTEFFSLTGNGLNESNLQIYYTGNDTPAIYAEKNLIIQWCDVEIYTSGSGIEGGGTLGIHGAKVYTPIVKGFNDIYYSYNSYLRHGQYDEVDKVLGGGNDYVFVDVKTEYDLYVAGVQVTNENKDDILKDQTVSFNSKSNTLKLNNANIEYNDAVISSNMDYLNISVIGENVLTAHATNCIDFQGQNLTIEGYTPSKSSLKLQETHIKGQVNLGNSSFSGNTRIMNCTVTGGYLQNNNNSDLDIERARINVSNIEGFGDVDLRNTYINSSASINYDKTHKYFATLMGGEVKGLKMEPYFLAYNGQDVNLSNPIVTESGEVSYDAENRILTMNNATLGDKGLSNGTGFTIFDDMTVKLEGYNVLNAESAALRLEAGDLTLQGPGNLVILAKEDALAQSVHGTTTRLGIDQSLTLDQASLYCWVMGRRVSTPHLIYDVNNSNFTFENNSIGSDAFSCKRVNLTNSKMIRPKDYNLDRDYISLSGQIVIEAEVDLPGDIDNDGQLTVTDVTNMINMLDMGLTPLNMTLYDINGDRKFTKEDVEALADKVLGR